MSMKPTFPRVRDSLLADMAELVTRLALLWVKEPSRPRPTPGVLEHWDRLIEGWSDEVSLPLYVRKSDNNRGAVISHPSGRRIVPTDNSPAQWAFALAVLGEQPSLEDIRRLIDEDRVPIAMILNAKEKATARYHRTLGKTVHLNAAGWKVAHVDPVGLTSRTSLLNVAEPTLRSHFRKLMAPRNMFAIPLRYAGLGELPEFCDAIRTQYHSVLHVAQGPE
jgi:hypothetical protein